MDGGTTKQVIEEKPPRAPHAWLCNIIKNGKHCIADLGTISRHVCTLGTTLGNNQAGLDRLAQANLVCKNAAAFAKTSKRKDYRVNLVGVGIDARLALRSGIALPVVRPADTDEILSRMR